MGFMTQAQQLANTLSRQFGFEEMHLIIQMRRGEDWITQGMYRNSEEPNRFHTTLSFNTGADPAKVAQKSSLNH